MMCISFRLKGELFKMRYQISHALVQFAADTILEDVNFEVHDHEKIAIVGRMVVAKLLY